MKDQNTFLGVPLWAFCRKTQREIDGEQLLDLMEKNRQAMIARNEPEMTLDEINAEIAAARAERKARLAKEAVGL